MTDDVAAAKHAVPWIERHHAKVLRFAAEPVHPGRIREHMHPTAQHRSQIRSQHEFIGEVCDALGEELLALVMAWKTALADFRHYVQKHRSQTGKRIAGYEVADHPTDKELSAMAESSSNPRPGARPAEVSVAKRSVRPGSLGLALHPLRQELIAAAFIFPEAAPVAIDVVLRHDGVVQQDATCQDVAAVALAICMPGL